MSTQGHTASAKKFWVEICFVNPLVSPASVYVCMCVCLDSEITCCPLQPMIQLTFLASFSYFFPTYLPSLLSAFFPFFFLFNFINWIWWLLTESLRMLFSPQNSLLPSAWSFSSHLFQEAFFAPILGSTKRHPLIWAVLPCGLIEEYLSTKYSVLLIFVPISSMSLWGAQGRWALLTPVFSSISLSYIWKTQVWSHSFLFILFSGRILTV